MTASRTCVLCGETGDEENPGADGIVIEVNPITMRRAAMHQICLQFAIDDLTPTQRDQYNQRIQK